MDFTQRIDQRIHIEPCLRLREFPVSPSPQHLGRRLLQRVCRLPLNARERGVPLSGQHNKVICSVLFYIKNNRVTLVGELHPPPRCRIDIRTRTGIRQPRSGLKPTVHPYMNIFLSLTKHRQCLCLVLCKTPYSHRKQSADQQCFFQVFHKYIKYYGKQIY